MSKIRDKYNLTFFVVQMLVDKETLTNVLNTAHDTHMLVLDDKEDKITQRASQDLADVVKDMQDKELVRNRKKVAEICQFIETLKTWIITI